MSQYLTHDGKDPDEVRVEQDQWLCVMNSYKPCTIPKHGSCECDREGE